VAEVVALRRQRRQPVAVSRPAAAAFATDPVCGMAVEVAGAMHVARHQGRDYHFCCGDCRRQFADDPDRFLSSVQAVG
jgi:YHS domain-containing protein